MVKNTLKRVLCSRGSPFGARSAILLVASMFVILEASMRGSEEESIPIMNSFESLQDDKVLLMLSWSKQYYLALSSY